MAITLPLSLEETDIIAACVRNESWAQQWIYEEHYSRLMGVCMRYASNREEAKDWLHDSFIKIFLNIRQYRQGTSLQSWLYRLVVNQCIDHLRKQTKYKYEELSYHSDAGMEPDIINKMEVEAILEGIQSLSAAYRAVFNLYVMEGLTHKEIAAELGITESTSRSNLTKARNQLRVHLSKQSS
jgi:RNA polymerase sigma factor (sigma-70 family)